MKKQSYKSIAIVFVLLFSFATVSNAAFDKREDRVDNYKANRIAPPGGDNSADNETNAPISDAIPFILGLALIYGCKKALNNRAIHNS